MSAGSRAGTLSSTARTMVAARSSGRTSLSEPLNARPMGERAVATTTASGTVPPEGRSDAAERGPSRLLVGNHGAHWPPGVAHVTRRGLVVGRLLVLRGLRGGPCRGFGVLVDQGYAGYAAAQEQRPAAARAAGVAGHLGAGDLRARFGHGACRRVRDVVQALTGAQVGALRGEPGRQQVERRTDAGQQGRGRLGVTGGGGVEAVGGEHLPRVGGELR